MVRTLEDISVRHARAHAAVSQKGGRGAVGNGS